MSVQPPDPRAILAAMTPSAANAPLTARDAQVLHEPENMRVNYGIGGDAYDEAQAIMHPVGMSPTAHVISPFSAIPVASSRGEYYEAIAVFAHESGVFMDPDDTTLYPSAGPTAGYHYQNLAASPSPWTGPMGSTGTPAPITDIPTSTTEPKRPRTVAAGYDKARRCLTVVFRDGTYYNYYEVSGLQWSNFKRARSKGRFIYTYLDSHPRGVADVSSLGSAARETLYRLSRTGQVRRLGIGTGQSAKSKRGGRGAYRSGNLGGTGRSRIKKNGTP